jgi:lysozyme
MPIERTGHMETTGRIEMSAAGLALLKQSEGFRSKVYLDVNGLPTIGYGHRLLHPESFPNGISEEQATQILASDVREAEQAVRRLARVPLAQGQFDALVDFCFNLGSGRLAASTLLADLNAGRYNAAAEQLLLWDHAGNRECAALRARREAEFHLWHQNAAKYPAAAQSKSLKSAVAS